MKKISVLLLILSLLSGCIRIIKDSEFSDKSKFNDLSKEIITSLKIYDKRAKKIVIGGFMAPILVTKDIGKHIEKIVSSIEEIEDNESCEELEIMYKQAFKNLQEHGFSLENQGKLLKNKNYNNTGDEQFPGLCYAGNTRLGLGIMSMYRLNKVIKELDIDGILLFYLNSKDNRAIGASLTYYVRGEDQAEIGWVANLKEDFTVEVSENKQGNIREKTLKVYNYELKLLLSRFYKEMY